MWGELVSFPEYWWDFTSEVLPSQFHFNHFYSSSYSNLRCWSETSRYLMNCFANWNEIWSKFLVNFSLQHFHPAWAPPTQLSELSVEQNLRELSTKLQSLTLIFFIEKLIEKQIFTSKIENFFFEGNWKWEKFHWIFDQDQLNPKGSPSKFNSKNPTNSQLCRSDTPVLL